MGSVNVRFTVVATVAALAAGCKSDSPLEPLERASKVESATAVDFAGVVGTIATSTPTVRVTDKDGDPVGSVLVTFRVTAGGGSVNPSAVETDASGRASTTWTLGTVAATQTLKASVGFLDPVIFSAHAAAGPPAAVERASSDNQILAVGTIGSPVRARVVDSFGNPVRGASVSFSVISGGGTIAPSTAVTDSAGVANASWTLGPVEGVQTAQATIGTASVPFTADTFSCADVTNGATCTRLGELIFARIPDGQIYKVNVDGTGLLKLTTEGSNSSPAWSPDGKRIAFIRQTPGAGNSDVYLMNADGTNVVRRTTGGQFYRLAWSPDGQRLAVEAPTGSDSLNIYTMSVDDNGSAPSVMITNAGSPAWSPDGKRIAYARGTGYYDASQIYVRNVDGTDAHRATADSAGWNWSPAWSPDGTKISFTRCSASCGVYTVDASSRAVTLLTTTGGSQDAVWSPNGKWLALTLYGSNAPSVGYLPATGGAPRPVATNAFHPSWRPLAR